MREGIWNGRKNMESTKNSESESDEGLWAQRESWPDLSSEDAQFYALKGGR